MIETRTARMTVNTSGGPRGGSSTFRATLPAAWVREIGLSEENRDMIIKLEGDSIMIKKDEIFLVITEDGFIIDDIEEDKVDQRDQVVFESDIESLVEVEMDDGIYDNEKEDFENEVDFYLQNAIREDYANYYIDTHLDTVKLTEQSKLIIQDEVIERIKERCK